MTRNNTGAFLSMGRIPQLIGYVVLAGGMLAGGASVLNAGGAKAVNPDPFAPGDPVFNPISETVSGATITGLVSPPGSNPTVGSGDVEFTYNGIASNNRRTWAIDADFAPNLTGPYSGTFHYSLTAPTGERWLSAALTQNIVPGFEGATVTKQIYGDYDGTNYSNPLFTTQLSVLNAGSDPSLGFASFNNPDTDGLIYVVDTYTGVQGAQLDNIINSVQTPGPLPILGAGAAFGFSRKLRGRIRAARSN